MKLIQLNAWWGRLEYPLLDFLIEEDADIICLQEAVSFAGTTGLFSSVEVIKEKTGLSYSAMAPVFSFTYSKGLAEAGNCVLSKPPIKTSEVIFTSQKYIKDFDSTTIENINVRNFIHATIEVNGVPVNVLTHHGYWVPEHKNGNEETYRQMSQLAEYVDSLSGPIILTGDFNLAPHSKSLELINNKLINLPLKHHLKTTRTQLTHKTEVCDYIFVNSAVNVKNFQASERIVSDHKALILEFDLKS